MLTSFSPTAQSQSIPRPSAIDAPLQDFGLAESDVLVRRKNAQRVLWGAIACGITADAMTWQTGFGLNLGIFLLTVMLAIGSLLRIQLGSTPRPATYVLGLAGLFAMMIAWHASEGLQFFNFLASLTAIVVAAAYGAPRAIANIAETRVRDLLGTGVRAGWYAGVGTAVFFFTDAYEAIRPQAKRIAALHSVARVALLAITLSALFIALLAAGDPVYRGITSWMLDWRAPDLAKHLAVTAFFAWPVMGLMWGHSAALRPNAIRTDEWMPAWSLRKADAMSVLISLNVVFATFVATQFRAFFGGQEYVLATTGLTLAEYARSGFFALTVTCGLVLMVLLTMNALLKEQSIATWRATQRLSLSLLSLVGVVMVSAAARMTLYMQAFGATVDRIIAMTVIAWLAVVCVWFAVTVLRNRPLRFAVGGMVSAMATLLALNIMNPDALVVQNHLERAQRGERFDGAFFQLMAGPYGPAKVYHPVNVDAVPLVVKHVLAGGVKTVSAGNVNTLSMFCPTLPALISYWSAPENTGLSGPWSIARWRAGNTVRRNAEQLRVACASVPASPIAPPVAPPVAPPAVTPETQNQPRASTPQ